MFSSSSPTRQSGHLRLSRGQLLTLTPACATSLQLRSGGLWVTQTGDDRDHFLKPGQSMLLAPGRLTVLQAQDGGVQASLLPMEVHPTIRRAWPWLLPKYRSR